MEPSRSISKPLPNPESEALRVVNSAKERGVSLRIHGGCAVRMHCPSSQHILDAMKRDIKDVDFVAYKKHGEAIEHLLPELGYTPDKSFIKLHGDLRQIYYDLQNKRIADIFLDTMRMCHVVDFRGRLELDFPTITLADLVLEKTQIVQITEKDIKDLIVLFREHEIGTTDNDVINSSYIAKQLSNEWGYYYTVTTNLRKVKDEFLTRYSLSEGDMKDVATKIERLLTAIDTQPKSLKWKARSKIGTKKQWYEDVETADLKKL